MPDHASHRHPEALVRLRAPDAPLGHALAPPPPQLPEVLLEVVADVRHWLPVQALPEKGEQPVGSVCGGERAARLADAGNSGGSREPCRKPRAAE
eukprot:7087921-Alexandrium_andersonii.AAC.1